MKAEPVSANTGFAVRTVGVGYMFEVQQKLVQRTDPAGARWNRWGVFVWNLATFRHMGSNLVVPRTASLLEELKAGASGTVNVCANSWVMTPRVV